VCLRPFTRGASWRPACLLTCDLQDNIGEVVPEHVAARSFALSLVCSRVLSRIWSGADCLRTVKATLSPNYPHYRICSFFRARVFSLSLSFALTNMNVYQEGGNDTIENTKGQVNGQQGEGLFGLLRCRYKMHVISILTQVFVWHAWCFFCTTVYRIHVYIWHMNTCNVDVFIGIITAIIGGSIRLQVVGCCILRCSRSRKRVPYIYIRAACIREWVLLLWNRALHPFQGVERALRTHKKAPNIHA